MREKLKFDAVLNQRTCVLTEHAQLAQGDYPAVPSTSTLSGCLPLSCSALRPSRTCLVHPPCCPGRRDERKELGRQEKPILVMKVMMGGGGGFGGGGGWQSSRIYLDTLPFRPQQTRKPIRTLAGVWQHICHGSCFQVLCDPRVTPAYLLWAGSSTFSVIASQPTGTSRMNQPALADPHLRPPTQQGSPEAPSSCSTEMGSCVAAAAAAAAVASGQTHTRPWCLRVGKMRGLGGAWGCSRSPRIGGGGAGCCAALWQSMACCCSSSAGGI